MREDEVGLGFAVFLVGPLELCASVEGVVDMDALIQRLEVDPDLVVVQYVD